MTCFSGFWTKPSCLGKPLRIEDQRQKRKVGFVAKCWKELIKKASVKFKVSAKDIILVLQSDGTEIDEEYFLTLEDHTTLILLRPDEDYSPREQIVAHALVALLDSNNWRGLAQAINTRLKSQVAAPHMYMLGHLVAGLEMNVDSESREEDPVWFQDVAPRFKSKDAYMKEKARARVRGFYYHAKDYIQNNKITKGRRRNHLEKSLQAFSEKLKKNNYYGSYFARTSEEKTLRYCDTSGWFRCLGKYDENSCKSQDHLINPYGARESRILFSTWELDHVVEKSREVLPNMLEAAKSVPAAHRLHWEYFFSLLFTRANLKLVHPVCHDKSGHTSAVCDPNQFYVKDK